MKTGINETAKNQTTINERRNTMKRLFATIATVFVFASLFIAPAPASALMFEDGYDPMSKPYFGHMKVLRENSTPLSVWLTVTPLQGLNSVLVDCYPMSPNGDGSYEGTSTESYYGWSLDFHVWFYRWGNYAFVRILTSCNGVFFDDRDEIFILTSTDELFN